MTGLLKSVVVLGAAGFALAGCMGSSSSGGGGAVGGGGTVASGGTVTSGGTVASSPSAPAPGSLIGDRQASDLGDAAQLAAMFLQEAPLDGEDAGRIRALLDVVVAADSVGPRPDAAALAGTASYAGDFAVVNQADDVGVLGDFAMSVNFDDGSLTGQLGSNPIVDDNTGRAIASGSAAIQGSVMGDTMSASLRGAYSVNGEAAGVEGHMSGRFVGPGAETVAGGMTLAVEDVGGPAIYEGVFAGGREAP